MRPYGSLSAFEEWLAGRKIVIPSAILGRYARSLADIVFEENLQDKVTEDLKTYNEIFRAVPDLLEVFHSPAVPRETREKLLETLMQNYPVNPITSNFLRILLQHNRILYFRQILDGFLKLVNERKGIVSARVTAAAPLSGRELEGLRQKLAGITGKLVSVESGTDPSLLGGIVVQIGSTVFDGSIRTQLADMKQRMSGS
jgi:F-type H+-transporting ATPase subunit delta